MKVGVAFGAALHWVAFLWTPRQVAQKVKELKEKDGCSLVVVSMHAGAEGEAALHVPRTTEMFIRRQSRKRLRVRAGRDRCGRGSRDGPRSARSEGDGGLQGAELIAYSLGNFATWGSFNVRGPSGLGLVLQVVLCEDGTLVGLRIRSTRQDKGSAAWAAGIAAEPDPDEGARKLVERLSPEDFQTEIARYYLPEGEGLPQPPPEPSPEPTIPAAATAR